MSLLEKTKVTHYIFIKNLCINEYFINKKSKTHTHTQEVQESKLYSSKKKKKKALNVAKWRAKRKRQIVQSRSLWTLVVQNFIQNVWPLFSFTFNSIFTPVFSPFQRDKFWVDLDGKCMAPFKPPSPPYQTTHKLIFSSIFSKEFKLVSKAVPVWLVECIFRYKSIPVYHFGFTIIFYIYKYVCVFVCVL